MIREFVKRRFGLRCAYYLVENEWVNCAATRATSKPIRVRRMRANQQTARMDYIEEVFNDYKHYSGVSHFTGRVAEVGPGDSCGVGLMFLADGCESVDLVDRFYSKRDASQHAAIYRALFERYARGLARLETLTSTTRPRSTGCGGTTASPRPPRRSSRSPIATASIVSRAVLEHVYDPRRAIERMAAALRHDGMLLHKVDFSDHSMFSDCAHELKFLEVPDSCIPDSLGIGAVPIESSSTPIGRCCLKSFRIIDCS